MTTPWPEKLASPWISTHITLSPRVQSAGEVLSSEYCFARVFPKATALMASEKGHNTFIEVLSTHRDGKGLEGEKL